MVDHSRLVVLGVALCLGLGACQGQAASGKPVKEGKKMPIKITSPAFPDGGMIPRQYTCDGADISPPLMWTGLPEKTKSLALICDDPDAPSKTWVHWVVFDIPADTNGFAEKVSPDPKLPNGAVQGVTDFGRPGYGGPCPPSGTHRYYFKLYALDRTLELTGRVTKKDLLRAMEGHVLADGQLMGRYQRR